MYLAKYRSQLYESEEKSKDDDSIPDSFGSDQIIKIIIRQEIILIQSSEDSYIKITKNSDSNNRSFWFNNNRK